MTHRTKPLPPSTDLLPLKTIPGSICASIGFRCAAVFCDIKKLGTGKGSEKGRKDDLALIVSDAPAVAAGMFTTNQVAAPPVKLSVEHLVRGSARAIVVNSGNANACTGKQGRRDAESMARLAATALSSQNGTRVGRKGRGEKRISNRDILVCSTGRIGVPMPMANIARGIRACAPLLGRSSAKARATANAIMTSDTCRKERALEFRIGNRPIHIGGICKGAGMIQPGLATMLAFITTDAAIARPALRQALATAVSKSFNRITVDGDMSTNDSVIVLANGLAGNPEIKAKTTGFAKFESALSEICLALAKMIVHDGEGVSRFVTLRVGGARNDDEAEQAARAIANSSLVRTSWCGGDPNWGRILSAMGASAAKVMENRARIGYRAPGERKIRWAFRDGLPTRMSFGALTEVTAQKEFDVHVDLRLGRGEFVLYATDLTEEYVTFNKGDVADPSSLGG